MPEVDRCTDSALTWAVLILLCRSISWRCLTITREGLPMHRPTVQLGSYTVRKVDRCPEVAHSGHLQRRAC